MNVCDDTQSLLITAGNKTIVTGTGTGVAELPLQAGEDSAEMAGERTTLGTYVEQYLRQRVRSGTLTFKSARNHRSTLHGLAKVYGHRPIHSLGRSAVLAWASSLGNVRASTRRAQTSQVRGFLTWLAAEGIVKHNPACHLPKVHQPRPVPRALDADAFHKLWATVPDVRGQAIVMLMFGLGLRCVEISRLCIEDWSRRDSLIRVTGKGGHQRELPVPAPVLAAVAAYLNAYPATSGPLIRSYRDPVDPLTADTLSTMVSRWMADAGIKHASRDGVSAHALRHSAASDLLDACADLRVVQEFLGHAQLSSTSVYLRRAGTAKMRDAMTARWNHQDDVA